MHGPDESLESVGVLDEIEGSAGLVVWQSLRDVTLWASTPPSERADLFAPGAERNRIASILTVNLDPDLEQPLGMVTAMVGRPDRVSAERVALACRRVSQWAEKNGKLATALAFAQAAAVSCPGDASAAFKVGQIARRQAEYVRSETWFRRAIALARQEGDWTSYGLGFVGLGNLYVQRGNFPTARKLHVRGLRAAKRHSLRDVQGRALHDLCAIAILSNDSELAHDYAREAFEAYGPSHANVPVLAQDVAYFWMTQGQFEPALRVFSSLRQYVGKQIDWIVLVPNLARAAGGAGERSLFDDIWREVWESIAGTSRSNSGCAEALLELARGAASLSDWKRAEQASALALEIARQRREARIEIEAEGVLQSVATDRLVQNAVLIDGVAVEPFDDEIRQFASELIASLNVHAAADC